MTVYLIGAGPGDPGLLTLRGAALLEAADVVVYDRLVDQEILSFARPDAELIDVGKSVGEVRMDQGAINELLVDMGARHDVVVRLKGGDPYVFGRGGEEAMALAEAGIAYECVPGVSVIAAVPGSAGVPLTMRGMSSSVTVVTGHDPLSEGDAATIPWEELAKSGATLVVLMGARQRAAIADRLLRAGKAPTTPVLVVERGTTPDQRSTRTTLSHLGEIETSAPSTIVIGDVAGLRLASIEDRPLHGWKVVVARSADQAGELTSRLIKSGARPIAFPTIAITDAKDGGVALRDALCRLESFDWLVFSSPNAVERVFSELHDARGLWGVSIAAMGSVTARALLARGIVADLVPTRYVADALIEDFPSNLDGRASKGGRVLIPRASIAPNALPEGLAARGWEVEVVEAYQTVRPPLREGVLEDLEGADMVIFTSSSTVTGFFELAGASLLPPVIASIGPVTSKTLEDAGFPPTIEAAEHTIPGLMGAILAYAEVHPRST